MGDLQTAMNVGKVVLVIAAITTTLFPILYAFAPWWRSFLGRSVMAQSLALGIILDLSVLFQFFLTPSSLLFITWLNIVILVVIAVTSGCLSIIQLRLLRERHKSHAWKQGL